MSDRPYFRRAMKQRRDEPRAVKAVELTALCLFVVLVALASIIGNRPVGLAALAVAFLGSASAYWLRRRSPH